MKDDGIYNIFEIINETFDYYNLLLQNNIINKNTINKNDNEILTKIVKYKEEIVDGYETEFYSEKIISILQNITNTYKVLNYNLSGYLQKINKSQNKKQVFVEEKPTNAINIKSQRLNMVPNFRNNK